MGKRSAVIRERSSPLKRRSRREALRIEKFWLERESFWLHLARSMIVLDDKQIQTIITAAVGLSTEKRDLFLKRIEAARRFVHQGHFSDAELNATINVALSGLRHDVLVPPDPMNVRCARVVKQ